TNEQYNCHCDVTASTTAYAASYVQMDRTEDAASSKDLFDNLVRYKMRWQMMTYDDTYNQNPSPVCTQGLIINGFVAGQNSGGRTPAAIAIGDVNGDGI